MTKDMYMSAFTNYGDRKEPREKIQVGGKRYTHLADSLSPCSYMTGM